MPSIRARHSGERTMDHPSFVIAGPDPAIHPPKKMDARVKPAHDGCAEFLFEAIESRSKTPSLARCVYG
jgi:hypothetical protein